MAPEFSTGSSPWRRLWKRLTGGKAMQRRRQEARRRLVGFEPLEGRRVLAATDLASILGLVFDDATGNGYTAGEEVVGATVNLYADDGDGVFEPGAGDALAATDTTDAAGQYRFDFLTAGGYWVQQPAQTVGATNLAADVSSLITITPTDVQGVAGATVIDPFNVTSQSVSASNITTLTDASSVAAPEAIGGERDLFVELTSATGSISIDVNGLIANMLDSQASSSAVGNRNVTWDGVDNDATALNATGLGGVDLTSGGADQAFNLTVAANKVGGQVMLTVYTDAANFSTFTFNIDDIDGTANEVVAVKFTDFTTAGGTGADFSNVGAIEMDLISAVVGVDAQLDLVGTLAPTTFTQNFANFESADLSITKTVDTASPNVGDNVTFTITVTNGGPDAATGVEVQDVLPAGLTFVSSTPSQGAYNSGTGVWTVGTLANGANATLSITASVASIGGKTNTAQVGASDVFDPDSTPGTGTGEDDDASAVVTPQVADLSVTKTVDNAAANVGQNVVFTVTVANAGPDSATNVTLGDLLPAGLTFVSAAPSQGSYNSATGVWTVGTIAAAANATLGITATVASTGAKTNTAEVTGSDQADSDSTPNNNVNTEDDQASAVVTPPVIDLSLTKTVNMAAPSVGSNVTFTITLANGGPDNATGVVVTDLLPAGLTFVSSTPSQGTYNDATGIWTVGAVNSAANATLQIVATVATDGVKTNSAEVTAADQADSDSTPNNANAAEDDQAAAQVDPQTIDLSLTKTVDDPAPNVGDNITYTVTVANAGPDNASGVTVTDVLPAGLTFVSSTPSQGTYNSGTGVWTIGNITSATNVTLQIVATVTGSTAITNSAEVTAADQLDSDSTPNNNVAAEDDQDAAVVTPQVIDLAVTKTVNDASPDVGDNVTFTVTLTNAGPNGATGVTVTDVLPAGLTFVSSTPSQGAYNSGTGVWTVGAVANGANATLQIVATVASAGAKTNSAQVTAADQFDSDSTPNNGVAAEDDQDSATVSPTAADLSLTKTVNDAAANVGDNVTFTITVSNAGPDGATGVVVTDALPAGLTFVSSTPSQGTYNSGTGVWTVGSVANGGTATLQLVATVANTGAKTNTAEITASDQLDPDSTPNNAAGAEDDQASATVTPPIADLSLTKTVDNASANVGQNVTFTVTVSNTGPDAATNVSVADALPAGLTFVSATPSQGTYNSGTGVWTVGTINSAANATLTITATVASTGTKTNTAQVQAVDQFDPDSTPGNSAAAEDDQASAAVAPPTVDLSLTKTVDDASPAIGQNVTFTTTLTNAGPATATGVVVTDVLPAGLTFVSATPSQGTYDAATGLWTVGSLAPGATVTLQVTATVVTGGPKTNTAQVSAVDQFDVDSTPNNNVPAEDDQDAALVQPPRTLSKRAFLAR